MAGLGDFQGVFEGLRLVREQGGHLLARLEVELGGEEVHPSRFVPLFLRADAEEDVLGRRVFLVAVVEVVRGDEGNAGFLRYLDEGGVHRFLLGDAVVLELQVEAPPPEQGIVVDRLFLGVLEPARLDEGGDLAPEAGREADQVLVVALQELVVDPGLVVEALDERQGRQVAQVPVALGVLGQQDHVVVLGRLFAARLVRPRTGGDVELAPDDGVDLRGLAFLVEFQGPEHVAMVGQGEMLHPELFRTGNERLDRGGPVEEREIRMNVEVDEICHAGTTIAGMDAGVKKQRVRAATETFRRTGACGVWKCGTFNGLLGQLQHAEELEDAAGEGEAVGGDVGARD